MHGNTAIIERLNQVLTNELTAINQYFLHAKILSNQGLTKLAAKERQESLDEMRHAEQLMDRILFLEGLPNLQRLGDLRIGENAREILQSDLDLEMAGHPVLKEAIAFCETEKDYVSRDLFNAILASEEEHIDFLETQLELIKQVGLENYLQSQM
ncbi:MAG: bacterioferritin [Spirochaetales bacterium]|nr:bacterioferritin [Spirochaetales bacterium]